MIKFSLLPFFLFFAISNGFAGVPARPEFGVLDQAGILPLSILKATERMLVQHEKLTQERISLYTLTEHSGGTLDEFGDAVLEEWRKDAPRPPSSVVILVEAESGQIEIRTGLGLDPVLTTDRIREIGNRFFKPEWQSGKKTRGVVLSIVEALRILDSPLISSGEVLDAYERAGFSGGWTPVVRTQRPWLSWLFALFGIASAAFVLVRIMIGEVHYTAQGWFRIPARKNLKRLLPFRKRTSKFVTGGGVSGEY